MSRAARFRRGWGLPTWSVLRAGGKPWTSLSPLRPHTCHPLHLGAPPSAYPKGLGLVALLPTQTAPRCPRASPRLCSSTPPPSTIQPTWTPGPSYRWTVDRVPWWTWRRCTATT